jgi:hypothetical protein
MGMFQITPDPHLHPAMTESEAHYELIKATEALARISAKVAKSSKPDSEDCMNLVRIANWAMEAEAAYWVIVDGR